MHRITHEQLDLWLQTHARRDDEYPFYTDRQLVRRDAKHPTLPLHDEAAGLPDVVTAYLASTRLADRLNALRLHPVDRAVAELRLAGCSVREIATRSGLKKWRVEKALQTVKRRLRAAAGEAEAGAGGWQEVYLAETRRRGTR